MECIKVIIAARQPIFCYGISAFLSKKSDLEVVGESRDEYETKQLCISMHPNILLLDSVCVEKDPCEIVQQLRNKLPCLEVILFYENEHLTNMCDLMEAGVKGYILKDDGMEPLLRAIYSVSHGDIWLSSRIIEMLVVKTHGSLFSPTIDIPNSPLTNREKEILQYLALGMSNQEIAQEALITERTVRHHIGQILEKFEVPNRTKAVVVAIQNRWITI